MRFKIKPPDLTPIVGLIERDLIDLARPSPTEFEPLLQLSLRQVFFKNKVHPCRKDIFNI